MAKFTIDRFHDLRPGRYCWRRCLVSKLLYWRDISVWCCVVSLLVRALKHPDAFERQVSKMSYMLVIIGRIGSDVCCSSHDCSFLGFGQ
jgi:hypothetical protein